MPPGGRAIPTSRSTPWSGHSPDTRRAAKPVDAARVALLLAYLAMRDSPCRWPADGGPERSRLLEGRAGNDGPCFPQGARVLGSRDVVRDDVEGGLAAGRRGAGDCPHAPGDREAESLARRSRAMPWWPAASGWMALPSSTRRPPSPSPVMPGSDRPVTSIASPLRPAATSVISDGRVNGPKRPTDGWAGTRSGAIRACAGCIVPS